MPKKPIKWGIKVWMLAEPETGYVSNFEVYLGKSTSSEHAGQALGTRVVISPYLCHLYFDNFFNFQQVTSTLPPSRLVGSLSSWSMGKLGNYRRGTNWWLLGLTNARLLYCHQTSTQTRQSQYSDGWRKLLTLKTPTCQHPSLHTTSIWEVLIWMTSWNLTIPLVIGNKVVKIPILVHPRCSIINALILFLLTNHHRDVTPSFSSTSSGQAAHQWLLWKEEVP